ncbi:hypothetical protein [Streptomyces sp. NPDC048340]|uniref:hypothetical protein n=1 Tax=Streptomyces sp. NPDC048340 TaxID=3365537 RepID=UPI003715299B
MKTEQRMWGRRPRKSAPQEKPRMDVTNDKETFEKIGVVLQDPSMPHKPYIYGDALTLMVLRKGQSPKFVVLTPQALVAHVGDTVDTYKLVGKEGKEQRELMSEKVARAYVNKVDHVHDRVSAVTTTPTLLPGGKILMKEGLDVSSGLYLSGERYSGVSVDVPPHPDEVLAAKKLLGLITADFGWVAPCDRANFIGYLFAPLIRHYRGGLVPAFIFTADNPGSGKSYLAELPGQIYGFYPAGWTRDDDTEIRKVITAVLTETSDPIVIFDNLNNGTVIRSASMAKLLTSRSWGDRVLGLTRTVNAPNNRVWAFTGNNIAPGDDLPRRCVMSRLTCDHPEPESRDAKQFALGEDLKQWADKNSDKLLHAMLVLVADWVAAGAPEKEVSLSGFQEWASVTAGLLDHIGVEGFLHDRGSITRAENRDEQEWVAVLSSWRDEYGSGWVRVSDVLNNEKIREHLPELPGRDLTSQMLGKILEKMRNRWIGKLRIAKSKLPDSHDKCYRWRVEEHGAENEEFNAKVSPKKREDW